MPSLFFLYSSNPNIREKSGSNAVGGHLNASSTQTLNKKDSVDSSDVIYSRVNKHATSKKDSILG